MHNYIILAIAVLAFILYCVFLRKKTPLFISGVVCFALEIVIILVNIIFDYAVYGVDTMNVYDFTVIYSGVSAILRLLRLISLSSVVVCFFIVNMKKPEQKISAINNINAKLLYRNCILTSISHAIMTNVYPELSYEQSWDKSNFSFQSGNGIRGTFSFFDKYCVGALRNDFHEIVHGEIEIKRIMNTFPDDIIDRAFSETLQYLLVDFKGEAVPAVSSVFWCDDKHFSFAEACADSMRGDIEKLPMFMNKKDCFEACRIYYEMDSDVTDLLNFLFEQKSKNFHKQVFLDDSKKKLFPGREINSECIKSLGELGIYFE